MKTRSKNTTKTKLAIALSILLLCSAFGACNSNQNKKSDKEQSKQENFDAKATQQDTVVVSGILKTWLRDGRRSYVEVVTKDGKIIEENLWIKDDPLLQYVERGDTLVIEMNKTKSTYNQKFITKKNLTAERIKNAWVRQR